MKKLCTNGISDSSRSMRGSPRATIPFAVLSRTMQLLATRKMLGELVSHDDDGDAEVAAERDDEFVELDRGDRVESGGRLVEEQQIGLEHHGARNAGALLHAARDLAGQMVGERPEADEIELRLNEIPHGRAAYRRPPGQREREVLGQCQELKSAPD